MSHPQGITAIVPCYNERKRLTRVIQTLKKAKHVNEIIVVDDGSDTATKRIIKKLKDVTVLTHPRNMGKTQALETGCKKAHFAYIFFIDADLNGLTASMIDGMVTAYFKNKPDILLGDRISTHWLINMMGLLGLEIAFTGERIIPQSFIDEHPEIFSCRGYEFESVLNNITFGKYDVRKYPLKGITQTYKVFKSKNGLGLLKDMKSNLHLFAFLGPKRYIYQCWYAKYRLPKVVSN